MKNTIEEFKVFRNTIYSVSNLGVVMNHKSGRIMKLTDLGGYRRVTLRVDGGKSNHLVHRMVAECFLSDYSELLTVNHKDGVRNNNRWDNIEMMTQEDNNLHSHRVIGNRKAKVGKRAISKLSLDGELIETYESISEAARQNDIHGSSLRRAAEGLLKTAAGFKWEYTNE